MLIINIIIVSAQMSYGYSVSCQIGETIIFASGSMQAGVGCKLWRERMIHRKNSGTSWDSNPRPSEY